MSFLIAPLSVLACGVIGLVIVATALLGMAISEHRGRRTPLLRTHTTSVRRETPV